MEKERAVNLSFSLKLSFLKSLASFIEKEATWIIIYILTAVSAIAFLYFLNDGLGLAYNDARSHLDIARRVVEGLKPGLAQIGSVWLPLPHVLMLPTIWSDFMWHTGLSGALVSMISFIATGVLIYKSLRELGGNILAGFLGVLIFATNLNILYLQSTAMTELLLLATMTAGTYELLLWFKKDKILNLIWAAFWIMLSTLVRYDGWFLFLVAAGLIVLKILVNKNGKLSLINKLKKSEGSLIFFSTLAGFGIFLWFLWNQLIFKDALYFAFGPFSAHAQQAQLADAGNLATKGNILASIQYYLFAFFYNSNVFLCFLGLGGFVALWLSKIDKNIKIFSLSLIAPLIFNIVALYFGFSVLFIQGLSGNTWFNVRYGIMMLPSIAIFIGFLFHKFANLRAVITGLILFVICFQFISADAVTIDDARTGSSQKNVTEVSSWLKQNTQNKDGFILISVASHDAIIFSSGLPMTKFIHEGTGKYWESATTSPDRWARWIVMRTHDENDLTFKAVSKTPYENYYNLVAKYPFADVYELKDQYLGSLNTTASLGKQK